MSKRFKQICEQETEICETILEPVSNPDTRGEIYMIYDEIPIYYKKEMQQNNVLVPKLCYFIDSTRVSDYIYVKFEGYPCIIFNSKQVVEWLFYWLEFYPHYDMESTHLGSDSIFSNYNKLEEYKSNNHIININVFNIPTILIFKEDDGWICSLQTFKEIMWSKTIGTL